MSFRKAFLDYRGALIDATNTLMAIERFAGIGDIEKIRELSQAGLEHAKIVVDSNDYLPLFRELYPDLFENDR